ncbi:MAG: ABC transporter substrate-binding protein, partial [Mesorhizobium sp.]
MISRRTVLGLMASAFLPGTSRAGDLEPEFLQPQLKAKALPALAERLPKNPRALNLAAMGRQPGQYGGTLRTIIGSQKDIRMMTIYGYARLVGYDEKLNLQADILESFDVADDRVFTFKIREGHKWSDGSLLTPEDFRYCWEDVWLNDELSQGGLAPALLANGKPPRFEIVDPS